VQAIDPILDRMFSAFRLPQSSLGRAIVRLARPFPGRIVKKPSPSKAGGPLTRLDGKKLNDNAYDQPRETEGAEPLAAISGGYQSVIAGC